jgi:hypothetical protein
MTATTIPTTTPARGRADDWQTPRASTCPIAWFSAPNRGVTVPYGRRRQQRFSLQMDGVTTAQIMAPSITVGGADGPHRMRPQL